MDGGKLLLLLLVTAVCWPAALIYILFCMLTTQ